MLADALDISRANLRIEADGETDLDSEIKACMAVLMYSNAATFL